jgi:hypothetical protein
MKTKWAAFAAILFVGVSTTLTAGDPAKSKDLAALEKKLVGVWIGQGGCDGKMVFQADGTYHVTEWTVGQVYGTGTWKIEWSELAPALVLSPTPIEEIIFDKPMPTKVSLLELDDEVLNFGYPHPNGSPSGRHLRGTESEGLRIRLQVLDQSVQSYLGGENGNKLPANFKALLDAKLLSPKSIVDPWGKEFQYDISGKKTKNKEVPDIWTETPEKKIIGNWSE